MINASGMPGDGLKLTPPPLPAVREAIRERRLAMGFAAVGIAVFVVAAILNPYNEHGAPLRFGTHRQLGLPACGLASLTGVGCPSCGMTTTFSLLAHGDLRAAWRTNWAGVVVAGLLGVGTVWFLLVAAGLPPGRCTADEVVKVMTMLGMAAATVRWLGLLGCAGWAVRS